MRMGTHQYGDHEEGASKKMRDNKHVHDELAGLDEACIDRPRVRQSANQTASSSQASDFDQPDQPHCTRVDIF